MLDFYLVSDDQPSNNTAKLKCIGGIDWEVFEEAQVAKVIESHLDYYGKFRWSNELVRFKINQLKAMNRASLSKLANILKQAESAECGLVAYGD